MVKETEEDSLVSLARETVEEFVRNRRTIRPQEPLPQELRERAGVFVCLKKHGQLRGCIGTIEPTDQSLAAEVVQNAIGAATRDPRFEPVVEEELADIEYTVDVLTVPQAIESMDDLNPRKYGVIVESGLKRGLLLPDLEGVDTVEDQVMIATRKAGIREGEPVQLYRFEVVRHGGS